MKAWVNNIYPMVPLGEVLDRRKDEIVVQDLEDYSRLTIRMNGGGVVERDRVPGSEIGTKRQFVVRTGQLLLSKIDARNGAFGVVPESCDKAIITGNFWAFETDKERLDARYLNYLTKTRLFIDFCIRASEGTTNRRYLQELKFLDQRAPLPPLTEQRRIVARIEELVARIEEARGLRRQAVEEAEALAASAAAKAFDDYADEDRVPVQAVCEVRGGIQKSASRTPGANPRRYITVAHVQRNWIDTSDPRFFEVPDAEFGKKRLQAGDVLVIEGNGSAEQIGRAALFRGEIEDCVHQNHVIRVRPIRSRLAPQYLNAYFNSSAGKQEMLERSRTTSGLFNLSVGRIKSIELPVPSLDKQERLVIYLEDVQAKVDSLKQLQAETAAELDALLPSVLDRAFKGKL